MKKTGYMQAMPINNGVVNKTSQKSHYYRCKSYIIMANIPLPGEWGVDKQGRNYAYKRYILMPPAVPPCPNDKPDKPCIVCNGYSKLAGGKYCDGTGVLDDTDGTGFYIADLHDGGLYILPPKGREREFMQALRDAGYN
jgi:hypothetical protein